MASKKAPMTTRLRVAENFRQRLIQYANEGIERRRRGDVGLAYGEFYAEVFNTNIAYDLHRKASEIHRQATLPHVNWILDNWDDLEWSFIA